MNPPAGAEPEEYELETTVRELPLLALLDPGDVRQRLAPVWREPARLQWWDVREAVQAQALVAPDEAEALLAQAAAATPADSRAYVWGQDGAAEINALVTSPERRLPYALAQMGFWIPEYSFE